ncbi:SDR family NAD(P)-dependent oxidoreductase, partial [Streptomyces sp. NPDC056161]|uniref:type I polyketide synthase n=1 Tax=Streptomyces sp. NPDC056161 TaxID=3345732 RepID=UPI0035DEB097
MTESSESLAAPTADLTGDPLTASRTTPPAEPVAVIGVSCRMPRADTPERFWELLRDGVEAVGEAPAGRWPDPAVTVRRGGFLDRVDRFDAAFFGISPREAAAMDPRQRLVLELSWEALERARIVPETVRGTRTGVFVGTMSDDYAQLSFTGGGAAVGRHTFTGSQRGIIANRVSYLLGLRGPSLTVDSGQSSSLVAVHLACESLARGECDTAIVGGVSLALTSEPTVAGVQFGGLSPQGRCFPFDARADGYVRGEGGGVVVLKPLAAARTDGDPILAVIVGSAVNNDGGGAGLTTPDAAAQADVVRTACRRAGADPRRVQFVETHGTGTPVGDPIEAAALGAALGAGRDAADRLALGSVKANIGHLEGGSGIAGLLKVVLSLGRRQLPPTLNHETPNPAIPLDELGLRVPTTLGPWPRADRPLLAGVSSFGMGGTNCHVLVAQAPESVEAVDPGPDTPDRVEPADGSGPTPLLLSGRTRQALRAQASKLRAHLTALDSAPADDPALDLRDLGRDLATTRTVFEHRAVVLAADHTSALAGLDAVISGSPLPPVAVGRAAAPTAGSAAPGPVFVFPGQGWQWPGMARELLESSPAFAAAMERCRDALSEFVDWDLLEMARGVAEVLDPDAADVVQPFLWAVMVSLAEVWRSLGVVPAAVVGHSQGEIAAATVAGALSLRDGARIVSERARLVASSGVEAVGGLASVLLPAAEAARRIEPWADQIFVAAVNGPDTTILAGRTAALAELTAVLAAEDIGVRQVRAFPSHSPLVEPMRDGVLAALDSVRGRPGQAAFYSAVQPGRFDPTGLDAEYWWSNLRSVVRFEDATRALVRDGFGVFVEMSAHPVLTAALAQTLESEGAPPAVSGTLRRGEGGLDRLLLSFGEAVVNGAAVDWDAPFADAPGGRPDLPTYAFQRRRFWLAETGSPSAPASTGFEAFDAGATADESDGFDDVSSQDSDRPAASADAAELLGLVRSVAAGILGHADAAAVDPAATFKDLGLDSLGALDLRAGLARGTGLTLPAPVLFSHPTPVRLAAHLHAELSGGAPAGAAAASAALVGTAVADTDPIAVVAMSCRYPGGVRSPEDLWRLTAEGRDVISGFPTNRGWDLPALIGDAGRPGASATASGGFLYDADRFDPAFFAVNPREAAAMDPQQRLLLETSWEAFERAGLDPTRLRGDQVGVFVGAMSQDYGPRLHEPADGGEGYLLTGSTASVASGRVAYVFGFEGPAVTVDTACSSSLVALHLAAQSLRRGECRMALAGGVAVMSSPGIFVEFSRQGGLSADGRCKAFGAGADGTGWAEGCGVVLLERLSDAQARGHRVLAVLRGSAINSDGASNGLTAPNGLAQERVIAQALASAGLAPHEVDAVEAHGTGTMLGDPIEAEALLAVYGRGRAADRPLYLGSIKSNIGHSQAAAGMAGVIKMVMALHNAELPRTLHAEESSPHIDWSSGAVSLLTEAREWPRVEGRPRRAGVSSFGISGTNAHVLVEEAPVSGPAVAAPPTGAKPGLDLAVVGPVPLVLSAKNDPALRDAARALADRWAAAPDMTPDEVGYALATTRAAFSERAVVLADDRDTALVALRSFAEESPNADVLIGSGPALRPVFVFPGQGAQWVGMGRELLGSSRVFAARMAECAAVLSEFCDWSLIDVVRSDGAEFERVDVVQPVLWAVMVSLAALWRSLGVEPAAVVGHSQGEIAAATVAGGLSLRDGARVVALRSQAIRAIAGRGGMMSVALPAAAVRDLLAEAGGDADGVGLAAANGVSSSVVSGPAAALEVLQSRWKAAGHRVRMVAVDYASHSAHVDEIRGQILEALREVSPQSGSVPFWSTVTAEQIDTAVLDAEYWFTNLRGTVEFEATTRTLLQSGQSLFLEASPHPVLVPALQETIEAADSDAAAVGTLRRGQGGLPRLRRSFAEALALGVRPAWESSVDGGPRRDLDLPTYPFQRSRYWSTATQSADTGGLGLPGAGHPLLGARVWLAQGDGLLLTARLSIATHPWLADHAVLGRVLLPGTAFVELALRAAQEVGCARLDDLTLQAPLLLPDDGAVEVQVRLGGADEAGRRDLAIHARPAEDEDADWTCHATGVATVAASGESSSGQSVDLRVWPPAGAVPVDLAHAYARLAEAGYEYGPEFRLARAAWKVGGDLCVETVLSEDQIADAARFGLHPALLDAALHPVVSDGRDGRDGASGAPKIPFAWSGVRLHAVGAGALRVRISPNPDDSVRLTVADAQGGPVADVESLTLRAWSGAGVAAGDGGALYHVTWVPVETSPVPEEAPVIVADFLRPADAPIDAATARAATARALDLIQSHLADPQYADTRLVVVTSSSDLAGAAVRGLVRSAQTENPGRLVLVETDQATDAETAVALVRPVMDAEPQLAVVGGRVSVPRLAPAPEPESGPGFSLSLSDGPVLITGGTGVLGRLLARHLVSVHGVRELVLVSRSGVAPDLVAELAVLGARVVVESCDVGDRAAVTELFRRHGSFAAVVHAAGILDDATVETTTPDALDRVFTAKADSAWHLHELISDRSPLILFSSVAAVAGNAGQGNYAAANAYLDALAAHRRALSHPALSLGWGLWADTGGAGMTSAMRTADVARLARTGIEALAADDGLALFDRALGLSADTSHVLPLRLGRAALNARAAAGGLGPVWRGLVRAVPRRAAAASAGSPGGASGWAARVKALSPADREREVLDLVRTEVSTVLGHAAGASVAAATTFKDLGFDSLTSVELRNRLGVVCGLRLPATVVFDR